MATLKNVTVIKYNMLYITNQYNKTKITWINYLSTDIMMTGFFSYQVKIY